MPVNWTEIFLSLINVLEIVILAWLANRQRHISRRTEALENAPWS
jgi:flagellar biogenesis protein FliO